MKKRLLIGAVALVVVAAIAIPWWQVHQLSARNAQSDYWADAQARFVQQYGPGNTILRSEMLDKVLVAYWQDSEYVHVSLELGAAWVEIYREPIKSDNATGTR